MRWRRSSRSIVALRNILCTFAGLLVFTYYKLKGYDDQIRKMLPNNAIKFLEFKEQNYEETVRIATLRKLLYKYNLDSRLLNLKLYGSVKEDAPVFVIFVDKYKSNLKYLVTSLQQVLGITDALIIFSHSYFDENVNKLVKSIDFARVLQIFFPYSLQLYPQEFPGFTPGDCPRSMFIDLARHINCTGAEDPDIHGLFRDPFLSQKKHFWWWTLNTVFEKLSYTKNHKGIFIFLEDDVFLLEDTIYMALQMQKTSEFVARCDIISLASVNNIISPDFSETRTYGANIDTWNPEQHSTVIAFDSSVWNSISANYIMFCSIDDYSWSRSLYYLSLNRREGDRFKVISSTLPRAFKTSKGVNLFTDSNILYLLYKILKMQKENHVNLFPSQLEVYFNIDLEYDEFVAFDYVDNNGAFADTRDRLLCKNMTVNKARKLITEMEREFHHYKADDESENVINYF